MKESKSKRIVVVDNTFFDTSKIINLSDKYNIPYELVNINQLVLDLNKYSNDILLIPDMMVEIINDYFKEVSNLQKQNAILISSSRNYQQQIKNDFSWLNILGDIDINSDLDEMITRIQSCMQSKIYR